jgi:aminoglycoside 6'-N-acetyltransferase I
VALRETAEGCTTTPVGYLEAWFVEPEWRGRGIGRQLVAAAEAWAREQGCTEMASDTSQEYALSPAAHAHLGFQEVRRDMYFRKALV